jgi:hypothetical protein
LWIPWKSPTSMPSDQSHPPGKTFRDSSMRPAGFTPSSDRATSSLPRLLVIHHSPTTSLRALTDRVVSGAKDPEIIGVEVVVRDALDFATGEATAEDLLVADGYLIGTSANFGYMSGALKHVFDSTFLQIGGALDASGAGDPDVSGTTKGRPFGLYVHGRYDTTGAVRSVLSISGALGWRRGYEVLEVLGDPDEAHLEAAYQLGGTIAALLTG